MTVNVRSRNDINYLGHIVPPPPKVLGTGVASQEWRTHHNFFSGFVHSVLLKQLSVPLTSISISAYGYRASGIRVRFYSIASRHGLLVIVLWSMVWVVV